MLLEERTAPVEAALTSGDLLFFLLSTCFQSVEEEEGPPAAEADRGCPGLWTSSSLISFMDEEKCVDVCSRWLRGMLTYLEEFNMKSCLRRLNWSLRPRMKRAEMMRESMEFSS